jgi:hypothetical protein
MFANFFVITVNIKSNDIQYFTLQFNTEKLFGGCGWQDVKSHHASVMML